MSFFTLEEWAKRHRITPEAVRDLLENVIPTTPYNGGTEKEDAVQAKVRLKASTMGIVLWRNNVGVLKDERGVPVRYGLCNDSKSLNESVKSSDLIGIKPIQITPDHVGTTIGQFIALEVKRNNWRFTATKHELAQLNFLRIVRNLGGYAKFTKGEL